MKRSLYVLVLPALLIGWSAPARASLLVLTGASAFNADSAGAATGHGVTATGTCCQKIFVELDTFTGTSTDYLGGGGIALTPGSHTIYLESADWTSTFSVVDGGINLFFDGDVAPDISIHLPTSGDKNVSTAWAVTSSSQSTYDLSNAFIPASGSSLYDNGVANISVDTSIVNWVGASGSVNPYDATQTVQRLDVTVALDTASAVPEPATGLLLAPALFWIVRRRRAHQSAQ